MAESADILTAPGQKVVLPDLAAGCSMADMATYNQVEECWDALEDVGIADDVIPVTYMNSSADIKAFTGRHGGTVCTSSNAGRALSWALSQGSKVLFLPDQHLGRNTAVLELGLSLGDCVVWDPHAPGETGGLTPQQLRDATMILWRGHCSVHGRFSAELRDRGARAHPRRQRHRAPGVPARGRAGRGLRRLDREDHRHYRRGTGGHRLGGRHGAEPRAAPGARRTRTKPSCSSTRPSATARR